MKKLMMACLFSMFALEVHALDFKCRSYNTGHLLEYKESENILYYRDRFGNELNAWAPVEVLQSKEDTIYYFEKEKILILDVANQSANALFNSDASFQCRVFTQE